MPPKSTAVRRPNLGVYLDRPSIQIPPRGLEDCLNVRIRNGEISNNNMGWDQFFTTALSGPCTLVQEVIPRDAVVTLIFGTTLDLYKWTDASPDTVAFLTPIYVTGTAAGVNGSTTVEGASSPNWVNAGIAAGDEINFTSGSQTDPTAKWYTIDSITDLDTLEIDENFAEASTGQVSYTIRLTYNGTNETYWRTALFADDQSGSEDKDLLYLTNGVDNVQQWDMADAQVIDQALGGMTCKELAIYKNMMIYSNITISSEDRPSSFRNSAIGEATNVTTKESSEFQIGDGVSPIRVANVMGDNLVIYKSSRTRSETVLAQFVGSPLNFIFRSVLEDVGAIAGRGVADFGDFHEFLGRDAMYKFDGVSAEEIDRHIWGSVLALQDPNRHAMIQAHFDDEKGELHWIFPLSGDANVTVAPEKAYTKHYLEEAGRNPTPYSIRELPALCTGYSAQINAVTFADLAVAWATVSQQWSEQSFSSSFPITLFGDQAGKVMRLSPSANDQDGGAIDSFVQFPVRALGDERATGLITRVYVNTPKLGGASAYTLTVTTGVGDRPDTDMTQDVGTAFDLTHGGNRFTNPYVVGRYGQVRFGTNGTDEPWSLSGYDLEVQRGGEA